MMTRRPALAPALAYQDPRSALDWLQRAFGFEVVMIIKDEQGNPVHAELRHGDGVMMIGSEWHADTKSPASIGHKCTQTVHVQVDAQIDAHCERARAAGADIIAAPEDQFYGDRTYRARDPEGHIWTFGQTVREVTSQEWDKAMGTTTSWAVG